MRRRGRRCRSRRVVVPTTVSCRWCRRVSWAASPPTAWRSSRTRNCQGQRWYVSTTHPGRASSVRSASPRSGPRRRWPCTVGASTPIVSAISRRRCLPGIRWDGSSPSRRRVACSISSTTAWPSTRMLPAWRLACLSTSAPRSTPIPSACSGRRVPAISRRSSLHQRRAAPRPLRTSCSPASRRAARPRRRSTRPPPTRRSRSPRPPAPSTCACRRRTRPAPARLQPRCVWTCSRRRRIRRWPRSPLCLVASSTSNGRRRRLAGPPRAIASKPARRRDSRTSARCPSTACRSTPRGPRVATTCASAP